MTAITWNVNSLTVRLPDVLALLDDARPDVLALQETKIPDDRFPYEAFTERGWHAYACGQRTYNGVAVITKEPARVVHRGAPPGLDDDQARLLVVEQQGMWWASVYAPNGQAPGTDKYAYKLRWFAAFADWMRQAFPPRAALLGDFNVAPTDRDVHDPKRWEGKILCSPPERDAFRRLCEAGELVDAVRAVEPEAPMFTWWDYRLRAFARGWGLRIDHVLVRGLEPVAAEVLVAYRTKERPSDHAPLKVVLKEA
ncbi:MAG: exodeoxyribonuclease III [Zetaproteobacteria bacterium]|nr:MAG: exodeoxyribonuclease III [Zetaproteobacteria bacterium]